MRYRELGTTGVLVSEAGLGCEYFTKATDREAMKMMNSAFSMGINIMDVFMPEPEIRDRISNALNGRRHQMILQGHVGAIYEDGQYKKTRDLEKSKAGIEDFLHRFHTDYIDVGMLHYVDTLDDWEEAKKQGIIDYMVEQKQQGVFKMLGVSSHNPMVAMELVKTKLFDVLMFSINPIFDLIMKDINVFFNMKDEDAYPEEIKIDEERAQLYALCVEMGVGITVMKALAGGSLLHEADSPFHKAMSVSQCMYYALNRPAVSSVLIGCSNLEEVVIVGSYDRNDQEGNDYADVISKVKGYDGGSCMYCNHCLPCVKHINIAEVTKLVDLATRHQKDVRDDYSKLEHKASQCIACGLCSKRCPFQIDVVKNMQKAVELFEK